MKNVKKAVTEKLIRLALSADCKSVPISFHEVEVTPELRRAIQKERIKEQN